MTRHESRCEAFCLMFEYSFGGEPGEIIKNAVEYREETVSGFAGKLFNGAVEHISEIDSAIAALSPRRAVNRIARVPLACLRIAVYELLFTDTPHEIAVNEAVEICREYNCEDSVSFVNGVLAGVIENAGKNGNAQ